MDEATIKRNFSLARIREEDAVTLAELGSKFRELAAWLNLNCQDSREKSLTMTKLEEAYMWAKATIERM